MIGLGLGLDRGGFVPSPALLLDTYAATAAYSLRKLRTDYSGSAIRVRRESDNAEQDIGFSGKDLDTAALTSFCTGTNGFVTTWYDQSGNGYNATQATAGSQEIIVNGGNVVQDSAGDPAVYNFATTLRIGVIPSLDQVDSQSYTIATVAEVESASTIGCFLGDASSGANFLLVSESGSTNTAINANYTTSSIYKNGSLITPTTRGQVYTQFHTNSPILVFCNYSTLTGFGGINDFPRIWSYSAGTTVTAARKVKEWIIYNTDQSANRTAIESNINDYYSIYP